MAQHHHESITMSRFWSPIVHQLSPYAPGEQPKGRDYIKLNTNENPYGPSPKAIAAISAATAALQLYPDPTASALCQTIADRFDLNADHIFVGNGSDEILAHAFNAFFQGKGPVQFADVTYSFYKTYCALYQVPHATATLCDDFTLEPADYRGATGGVIVANPNAPTGIAVGLSQIEHIVQQNPDVVVLVDEAYVDFGAQTVVALVPRYDNLIVVQTLSKSRSLAGLRVGFAVAQPHLIAGLVRIKDSFNSYPLDRLALAGAKAAMEDVDWFEQTRQKVMLDRKRLSEGLTALGCTVLPSAANFVFVTHPVHDAASLAAQLRDKGILVRHFDQDRIRNWLRITVGTTAQCDSLLAALAART